MLSDTDCNGRYTQSAIALAMRSHHCRKPPLFPDASMRHVAWTSERILGACGLEPLAWRSQNHYPISIIDFVIAAQAD